MNFLEVYHVLPPHHRQASPGLVLQLPPSRTLGTGRYLNSVSLYLHFTYIHLHSNCKAFTFYLPTFSFYLLTFTFYLLTITFYISLHLHSLSLHLPSISLHLHSASFILSPGIYIYLLIFRGGSDGGVYRPQGEGWPSRGHHPHYFI